MSIVLFFNDTATTEIYTLSLHDALPIFLMFTSWSEVSTPAELSMASEFTRPPASAYSTRPRWVRDRKSTRLNSSHANISYAVFCLKKNNDRAAPAHTCLELTRSRGRIIT